MSNYDAIKITDNVYWVGAIDWELRDFHGYSTSRGTTYNAYLIVTDDKPILIDTVKAPFFDEMMARIRSVIDPQKIAYIISNHAEMDHSGSLPQAINAIQPEKVYASKPGVEALKAHLHLDYALTEIKNGETLMLGKASFKFIETRMLHWPDSMFTYFENDGVLFTQDAFGMHLATSQLYVEENDPAVVRYEASKYYANILMPYSPLVSKLLAAFPSYQLDIKVIAPDHGPIWRRPEDIQNIVGLWTKWAQQAYCRKVVIIYDTMWESTKKMAHVISDVMLQESIPVKILPLGKTSRADVATELLEAGALLVGTPTINQQMFPTLADVLCYLKGLKPKNLVTQVFGSYGWAPEGIKQAQSILEAMKLDLAGESLAIKYVPTQKDLEQCKLFGTMVISHLTNLLGD